MTVKNKPLRVRLATFVLAVLLSPAALALGLGEAQVRSYMRQPLDLKIKLISRSEAELATVTAGLASIDDFKIIGLDRAALSVPMNFQVVRDLDDPHIRVTSTVPVADPVVQLVVEVVWSSGRMLRQYTIFLDPPTFESAAPLPQPSPRPEPAPPAPEPIAEPEVEVAEQAPDETSPFLDSPPPALPEPEPAPEREPEPEPEPESVAEASIAAEEQAAQAVTEEEPLELDTGPPFEPESEPVEELAQAEPEAAVDEAASLAEDEAAAEPALDMAEERAQEPDLAPQTEPDTDTEPEPEPVIESQPDTEEVAEPEPAPPPEPEPQLEPDPRAEPELPPVDLVFRAVVPAPERSGEVYGPVQRGETLWGIANEWGQQHGHAVNQVMLAIQQQNPGAFNKGNINSLKSGAVLRMPTSGQVGSFSARQAMLEVMRQEDQYRNRWDTTPDATELPAIADIAARAEPEPEPLVQESAPAVADEGRLDLVPPSTPEESEQAGFGQGNSDDAGSSGGESVVEELARAQEELANAQQENTYLNERLIELEAELARREAAGAEGVEDTGLAEMEQRLREQRQQEPETADTEREDASMLGRFGIWLAVLAGLLAAAGFWWWRTRGGGLEDGDEGPPEPQSSDPAPTDKPDIPEADDQVPDDESTDNVIELGRYQDEGDAPGVTHLTGLPRPDPDEEAVELDSTDPETKLDLARAYISVGDTEAARTMLEEVLEIGTEEQAQEARTMMEEL